MIYPALREASEEYERAARKLEELNAELPQIQAERSRLHQLLSTAGGSVALARAAARAVVDGTESVSVALDNEQHDISTSDPNALARREAIVKQALVIAEQELNSAHTKASAAVCKERRPEYLRRLAVARAAFVAASEASRDAHQCFGEAVDTGASVNAPERLPIFSFDNVEAHLGNIVAEIDRLVGADLPNAKRGRRAA